VRIYVDGVFRGEARTGPDRSWTFSSDEPPEPGAYRIRADQIADEAGAVAARAEVTFRYVDLEAFAARTGADGRVAPAGEDVRRVVIERGDNLWNIAAEHYGDGFKYTTIFRANFVQIADPDLIFPGQVFDLPGVPAEGRDDAGTAG
jgi:nucleoid-associated protein YgaU